MKIETIYYRTPIIAEIRNRLPEFVKQAMMKLSDNRYDANQSSILVDARNYEVVEYLDCTFRDLIFSGKCLRRYEVAIDKKEIPNYSYFYILPEHLEYQKCVFADVKMPTCTKNTWAFGSYHDVLDCNIGGQLLSPVKVKRQKAEKLDIAVLNYTWEKEVVLLLSARIKKIFESENITGLVYEPAQFIKAAHRIDYIRADGISHMIYKEVHDDNPVILENPYIARFSHNVYVETDRIFFEKYRCEIHLSIDEARYENPRILKKEIRNKDFFQVEGVRVKGKIYPYQNNYFRVSRKVLEILLRNDAKGLHRVGSIIKSKFTPVIEIVAD